MPTITIDHGNHRTRIQTGRRSGVMARDWNAFPSYTLAQLEKMAEQGPHPNLEAIKKEIAARKDGTSTYKKTPQVAWK